MCKLVDQLKVQMEKNETSFQQNKKFDHTVHYALLCWKTHFYNTPHSFYFHDVNTSPSPVVVQTQDIVLSHLVFLQPFLYNKATSAQ